MIYTWKPKPLTCQRYIAAVINPHNPRPAWSGVIIWSVCDMKCSTCKYLVPEDDFIGHCHRFPPVVINYHPSPHVQDCESPAWSCWPEVQTAPPLEDDWWCGEYKEAEPLKPKKINKNIDLDDFGLRTKKCLNRLNIKNMEELSKFGQRYLLGRKFFGPYCLKEVKNVLSKYGYSLNKNDYAAGEDQPPCPSTT